MGKRSQMIKIRGPAGIFIPISRTSLPKPMRGREWRRDLLMSWLFQTCIRLQTSLNRRFLKFGLTGQEASVLLRCVEARRISASQLSVVIGRDKGMITRFIGRLETSGLVKREAHPRDGRLLVIRPTGMAKKIAPALATVFERVRKELFEGVLESDEFRLGRILPKLSENATCIGARERGDGARRNRTKIPRRKTESPPRSQPLLVRPPVPSAHPQA